MKLFRPLLALSSILVKSPAVISTDGEGIDMANCPLKCYNGSCKYTERTSQFYCECPKNAAGDYQYTGTRCETPVKICIALEVGRWECLNDSTCNYAGGAIACNCIEGFSGRFCKDGPANCRDGTKCLNGGDCHPYESRNGKSSCICPDGTSGDQCENLLSVMPKSGVTLNAGGISGVAIFVIIVVLLSAVAGSYFGVQRFKSGIDRKHMKENPETGMTAADKEPVIPNDAAI
eukprot:CAMPEP_0194269876 /NCGR_PEP_ID=MMETSP0169-20130528/3980_1 /TAXON_ID=218684 /ORGANISM="Corethron pennatum, Strain L29A3" /LENGTH=232 /DNA_ID=CAMNT_0039011707 /DNA_START=85 /DNA_END=783 /DNA_ORIENTATION=-